MSFWTTQIKLRKPVHRMIGALMGGTVVKLLTTVFLFPAVFYWMGGWSPPVRGRLFLLIFAGITSFVPLYLTVWIHWGLTPNCKASAWSRNARLVAATAGWIVEVALHVLLFIVLLPISGPAVNHMITAGSFASAGILAIWLFGRLKPTEEGPISRRRRRERVKAGLCATCGYNLSGLTEPRCPECSTEFDPTTLPQFPDR